MIKVNENHPLYEDFMEIVREYEYGRLGTIKSNGKFEGEPYYVPWFWDKCLNGNYEEIELYEDVVGYIVELDSNDYELLSFDPEIVYAFILFQDSSGFVNCQTYTEDELKYLRWTAEQNLLITVEMSQLNGE